MTWHIVAIVLLAGAMTPWAYILYWLLKRGRGREGVMAALRLLRRRDEP